MDLQTNIPAKVYVPVALALMFAGGMFLSASRTAAPTATAAPTVATVPAAPVPVPDDWYFGHIYAEACVPVDDVNFSRGFTERLYYHVGDMHNPADVKRYFEEHGASITEERHGNVVGLHFDGDPNRSIMILINGAALCRSMMAGVSR